MHDNSKETNWYKELREYSFFVGTDLEKRFMDIGCKK